MKKVSILCRTSSALDNDGKDIYAECTSDGLGFHEYPQLAEDLNAKPLYVVNIGIWHGPMTTLCGEARKRQSW